MHSHGSIKCVRYDMMKFTWLLCLLSPLLLAQNSDGVLDLTQLLNYANQTVPDYITRDNTTTNAITDAGATLGRVLFYDKRLSSDETISCSSCHQQANAFSDLDIASTGVAGTTGRHSMRLINARFADEDGFFWDERAATLEHQTTQPIRDHVEMGFSGTNGDPDFSALLTRLEAIEEYPILFDMAFGDPAMTEARLQQALAQFVRSIQSFDSKYDVGAAQVGNLNGDFPNFTADENAGKQLFQLPPPNGGAGCATCHRPPEFDIDPNSLNNGVVSSIGGGTDTSNTRSPSLRDLVKTDGASNGPFMHDGSIADLAGVIAHYNQITPVTNLDRRLNPPGGQNLNLTATEQAQLVAFLGTLSGTSVYTDERWSDPFTVSNELHVIILPENTMSVGTVSNNTLELSGVVAPGLRYDLERCNNLGTGHWYSVDTVIPANDGSFTLSVTNLVGTDPSFYRLTYTP